MKYKTKPFEIEAVKFTGKNFIEIQQFVGYHQVDDHWCIINFQVAGTYVNWDDDSIVGEVYDHLHSSWVGVKAGQYIIKGMKDEFYPCDAEVFEAKYEPVFAAGGAISNPVEYVSDNVCRSKKEIDE